MNRYKSNKKYNNMNKLPIDIIREKILPYTYQPQSKELCYDIRSFYNIRDYLCKLYYKRWNNAYYYEENADLNWLDNDLGRFCNDDKAMMYGFTDNCIAKYSRIFGLKNSNRKKISNYINKITVTSNVIHSINIQIGILNVEERLKLVDFVHSLDFELVE